MKGHADRQVHRIGYVHPYALSLWYGTRSQRFGSEFRALQPAVYLGLKLVCTLNSYT